MASHPPDTPSVLGAEIVDDDLVVTLSEWSHPDSSTGERRVQIRSLLGGPPGNDNGGVEDEPPPTPTHFASPSGGGSGAEGSPFLVSDFWEVAEPGDVLALVNGTYLGADSMIVPPAGTAGSESALITVRALNDGGALIDGEYSRVPINLLRNRWLEVRGVNARRGTTVVVGVRGDGTAGSHNNVLRRICAWDAGSSNSSVYQVGNVSAIPCTHNLIEDCVGLAPGERIFQASQGANHTTLRRTFGLGHMWKVYQVSYQCRNNVVENCIGSWDALGLPQESDPSRSGRGILTFGRLDHTVDGTSDPCTSSAFLGCIAFLLSEQDAGSGTGQLEQFLDVTLPQGCLTYRDMLLYSEQVTGDNRLTALRGVSYPSSYADITEISPNTGQSISSAWTITNRAVHTTVGAAPSPWAAPGSGARVRYRYVDGVLTDLPLWPWPMDSRIRAAYTLSGRNPDTAFRGTGNSVTQLLASIFGAIPGV